MARSYVRGRGSGWAHRIVVIVVIAALTGTALTLLYIANFRTRAFGDAQRLFYAAVAASDGGELSDKVLAGATEGRDYFYIRDVSVFQPYLDLALGGEKNLVALTREGKLVSHAVCVREQVFFGRYGLRATGSYPRQSNSSGLEFFRVQPANEQTGENTSSEEVPGG